MISIIYVIISDIFKNISGAVFKNDDIILKLNIYINSLNLIVNRLGMHNISLQLIYSDKNFFCKKKKEPKFDINFEFSNY